VARRVAGAELDFLVLARFAFPRLVLVVPRLAAAFFVVERFLRLRGFSVVPVTASAMLVAALDTPSMAASMLVLAVSAIVPRTPSFSLSMLSLSFCCPRRPKSRQRVQNLLLSAANQPRFLNQSPDICSHLRSIE